MTDKYYIYLMGVLWGIVVAVADMKWPDHMGGSGHLMSALGLL